MTKESEELSTTALLGVSLCIALGGLILYTAVAPLPPATYVAMEHSLMERSVTR